MKKIHLYILFLGLFSLSSCDIETEPLTQLTDTNFYQTPDDAYTALVGCYDGMQVASGGIGGLGFNVASEVLSDNCFGGTGNSDGYGFATVDEFDITVSPGDIDLFNNNWVQYYRALYRCNVLLTKLDQIDWNGDDALRNTYESETRFIRAFIYFEMVRLWGNIPLIIEPTTENVPQADPVEVYTLIAEDLLFAANNLADNSYNSVESGRVTKWAAKSLLARVYLYYTGYYGESSLVGLVSQTDALGHVEDVISSSGHSLVNDFANLWPAASGGAYVGEDNEEIVFSVKHTYTSDYNGNTDGNHWMVMFGMRGLSHYPYGAGWGVTVNPKLWNAYNSNDTRRDASIISITDEGIPLEINDAREYTGYYNKKYTPMSDVEGNSTVTVLGGADFQIGQFQDYIIMRYSDVLLMAAELGSGNAQNYFDEVRMRAYQGSFSSIPVTAENILTERQLEFSMEGLRYWDLLRQGIANASSEINEDGIILLSGGVDDEKVISASNITTTKGLQQIPDTQITLSGGVLIQNTGW